MDPKFVRDLDMQRFQSDTPTTSCIHNKIDELISNRREKCSVY